ncbi:hypothetical protein LJB87_00585 [Alistipes sp. OttesenSCG-928-L06]|nr:hypothetical protein [Alistipes sp. OttesenSCG-928-L06]
MQGEYIHSKNDREKDWEYNFKSSLGTFMSTMAPTLEAYKKLYGGDTPVEQKGYSVQAGWLILGGDYQYNRVDALMGRPGAGSLELVLRYNHTDLNDLKGGSYYNGKFYDNSLYQSFGLANGSFIGGKATTYTVGVNYYVTRNVMVKFNYGYTDLDNQYSLTYNLDKKMHSLHLRLGFEF